LSFWIGRASVLDRCNDLNDISDEFDRESVEHAEARGGKGNGVRARGEWEVGEIDD